MSESKISFNDLVAGHEFPASDFVLDRDRVTAYLEATGSDPALFLQHNIVPPMAVTALSMGAMMDCLVLPPGAIHVSQDVSFHRPAGIGERLTSQATVKRKVDRSRLQMLTISITVNNDRRENIMTGETGFIIPQAAEAAP